MPKTTETQEIELEINGRTVEGNQGDTVLEVAQKNGIDIPTLCHMDEIEPTGACRMCLAELEETGELVTSCTHPASDGLKVETENERLHNLRKLNLELQLTNTDVDMDCTGDETRCELANLVREFDLDPDRFAGERRSHPKMDDNPFFELDHEKCILCGRCVRVCDEIRGRSAIELVERGFQTKVAPPLDESLTEGTCQFCGQCVDACPSGALTSNMRIEKGNPNEVETTSTICTYCGVGCRMNVYTRDGEVVDVSPDPEAPANDIRLCSKGRFGFDFVNREDRLSQPLIKEDDEFREASWEEALDLVSDKLGGIKEQYGPDAIAGLSSATCTNEENYLFQKFMRATIGTNSVDHCARLCHSSTVAGLVRAFGSGAMTNSIGEIRDADTILVTGSNTTESHPVIGLEVKKAVENGSNLIVADPREIELVQEGDADIHMRQNSGTDVAWLMGMINIIIEEGLVDEEFVKDRTENFEAMREAAAEFPPDRVEEITGVDEDKLREAALMYGEADKGTILFAMGITQHSHGTDNVLSVANLAMVTGNVGKESTGVNPLRGQNNVQGACDLGALPNVYPGYQNVDEIANQEKFEEAWGTDLSPEPGLTVVEMMDAAGEGDVKGMYIMGENPMVSDPDIGHVEESLENLDFLAVQDIFLTETAEYADVVLPAASFAETEGSFTNSERRIQKLSKALEPKGNTRPDWKIISDLSTKLDNSMSYSSAMELTDEITEVTPIYGGITSNRIQDKEGLQWPCRDENDPGTKFLHEGEFSRGLGKFHAISYREPAETPDEDYPMTLTTGRMYYHFHTRSMTGRSKGLDELVPKAYVEMNPADASSLEVEEGEKVKVSSRRGEIEIKTKVTDRVPEGTVFIPFHFAEAAANRLTNPELDPIAKIPELKVAAVDVEKIN
ncbi:MAG: formate dehydrogenase subunit alpha [Candidatus Bipolaricaulota bacterium]|nr:formate dehydrogenase subunit alpha [Candidatus Bipolaricaulota bacterium]